MTSFVRTRRIVPVALGILLFSVFQSRSLEVGQSAEILFPSIGTDLVRVSPTGSWVAARSNSGNGQGVMVQRVGLAKIAPIGVFGAVRRIAWDGPDTLLVDASVSGRNRILLVELDLDGDVIQLEKTWFPPRGFLVDATPLRPGELIWEFEYDGKNSVHRVTIDQIRTWNDDLLKYYRSRSIGNRLAIIDGSSIRWIVDRSGMPRAAWRRDEEGYSILTRTDPERPLEVVYRFTDREVEREIIPVGLAADEVSLLVTANNGEDFKGLYEFDPGTGKIGAVVFRPDDADVTGLLVDDLTRELIGAYYAEAGELRTHYFDAYRDRYLSKLEDLWEKESISVVSGTADRQTFVFFRSDATNPGEYFFREPGGRVIQIARIGQEIDRNLLAPVRSMRVESKDGVEVEAFLSIPSGISKPAPLVVMPHGGPIGVHDVREYDPIVQYLTSWGFAVLQVNYRGSSGYGLSFEKLGKKQWARGIEDDIDAAVEHAMALPEIDEASIGIIGGSYGGFSALVSVIRHKDRYRCAATINGVSDIPLLYDSSDFADSKRALEFLEEFIGDLETERHKLIEVSPAYHMESVTSPVLIIQGTADRRVDPDHAHRLILMLELYGKEYDSMFVKDGEHSFDRDEWILVVRKLRHFLTTHLQPGVAFRQDPETASESRDSVMPDAWEIE